MTMTAVARDLARGAPRPLAAEPTDVRIGDPRIVDLIVYRGDTGTFRVTVVDANGAPLDVTAATFDADIRTTPGSSDAMTTLTVTKTAGDPTSVDVSVDATQSNTLVVNAVWDLEMRLAGQVVTLLAGDVIVTGDVSRTP